MKPFPKPVSLFVFTAVAGTKGHWEGLLRVSPSAPIRKQRPFPVCFQKGIFCKGQKNLGHRCRGCPRGSRRDTRTCWPRGSPRPKQGLWLSKTHFHGLGPGRLPAEPAKRPRSSPRQNLLRESPGRPGRRTAASTSPLPPGRQQPWFRVGRAEADCADVPPPQRAVRPGSQGRD